MPMSSPEEQRKYQREWRAKRRADWFAGKTCIRCGDDKRLQIDHIEPNQKVSHNIWSWTAARRNKELAKCQVLCFPCHMRKTRMSISKLTPEQVTEMRKLDLSQNVLAQKFGVSRAQVRRILAGVDWKHV